MKKTIDISGKIVGISLVVIFLFITLSRLDISVNGEDNRPVCPLTEKKCYKYFSSAGLFGGVSDKQVSCLGEYDFYRMDFIKNDSCKVNWDNLKNHYED